MGMESEVQICMGRSVLEYYVLPDRIHGGYGIKIVHNENSEQGNAYCCAMGLDLDRAKRLSLYLHTAQAMPGNAEELIEDWLCDHGKWFPAPLTSGRWNGRLLRELDIHVNASMLDMRKQGRSKLTVLPNADYVIFHGDPLPLIADAPQSID